MVSSRPFVSAIMPVFNAERFVAEAVESILRQSYELFELLVIDDGSTDGSRVILEHYAQLDGRIKLSSGPNRGVVAARNALHQLARGEFIAVMDADDVALPERFERQVACLADHPEIAVLGSQVMAIDDEGDPLCRFRWPAPRRDRGCHSCWTRAIHVPPVTDDPAQGAGRGGTLPRRLSNRP